MVSLNVLSDTSHKSVEVTDTEKKQLTEGQQKALTKQFQETQGIR